jgi:hypothetical protein
MFFLKFFCSCFWKKRKNSWQNILLNSKWKWKHKPNLDNDALFTTWLCQWNETKHYINGHFFDKKTCHESQRLSKISTTHFEVLLAFELSNNHYHKRINSHIFKMKDDCHKIFHKRNINYLNFEGLFHTWTYVNLKGKKSIKGFS